MMSQQLVGGVLAGGVLGVGDLAVGRVGCRPLVDEDTPELGFDAPIDRGPGEGRGYLGRPPPGSFAAAFFGDGNSFATVTLSPQ